MFCQTFGIQDMRHYGTFPGMRLAFHNWLNKRLGSIVIHTKAVEGHSHQLQSKKDI